MKYLVFLFRFVSLKLETLILTFSVFGLALHTKNSTIAYLNGIMVDMFSMTVLFAKHHLCQLPQTPDRTSNVDLHFTLQAISIQSISFLHKLRGHWSYTSFIKNAKNSNT